jgi:peptide/nickel transport system substrate-binding protein
MPFVSGTYSSLGNIDVQEQMWPSLYEIGTPSDPGALNTSLSLADAPVYSAGNTVVTITLKPYKWSDGSQLTSRDVTFFLNLLKANKTIWAHYTAGDMPDNVKSWVATNSTTIVMTLTHAYNPTWFTDDQLAEIVPMPQHAWDKTSSTGSVGNYDETAKGALAVYAYLNKQGQTTSSYDTNPLWKVVDGAWSLQQFQTTGHVVLVPNHAYSGPDKPHLASFEMLPFTAATSEFNAVLSGNVDVGYIPDTDLATEGRVESNGYSIVRSELEAANMLSLNYDSPVVGPLVKQLYIREALNDVMDQAGQIKALLANTAGYADYGPIPPQPVSPYLAPSQLKNPFDISAAKALLTSHGWTVPSSGTATCTSPGMSSSECGAGIARGKALSFSLVYDSGSAYLEGEMENYKSDAAQVGIVLNLSSEPFNSIVGAICGTAACDSPGWQIANWGAGFSWDYGVPDPTGANLFEGHVGLDYPPTSELKTLISATETAPASQTVSAMRAYDTYVVSQYPVVWQLATYYINAVSKKVGGVVLYASGNLAPQDWYLTKSS